MKAKRKIPLIFSCFPLMFCAFASTSLRCEWAFMACCRDLHPATWYLGFSFTENLPKVKWHVDMIVTGIVILVIALILHRFFAICYPMQVKSICTTRRAKIIIPILWIISAACGSPALFSMVRTEKLYSCLKLKLKFTGTHGFFPLSHQKHSTFQFFSNCQYWTI